MGRVEKREVPSPPPSAHLAHSGPWAWGHTQLGTARMSQEGWGLRGRSQGPLPRHQDQLRPQPQATKLEAET